MSNSLPKPTPQRRRWLGIWWVSWFGIIGGFLTVAVEEFKYESPPALHFSLAVMIVTFGAWVIFFVAEDKIRSRIEGDDNKAAVVDLLSVMGTLLTAVTLLGIGFFVSIAPRLR